jgi:hypothetical protein
MTFSENRLETAMSRRLLMGICAGALGLAINVQAQSPPNPPSNPPQQSPAKPPPQQQKPAPTKVVPPSANPEDPHTATTGGADKSTFQAGKKLDDSAGCSTPTDAQSAGVDTSRDSAARRRSDGKRTVCTTAGAGGVGSVDKSKRRADQQKPATSSSSSAKPR